MRRVVQHGLMVSNHSMLTHHTSWCTLLTANIHTNRHIAAEFVAVVDKLRDSLCLIGCQGVHRVDNKRFDSPLITMPVAILQNRVEETFGFTGAGASRN